MSLIEEIDKLPKPINVFVDMDGVVACYDVGQPDNYHLKRPLLSNIKKIEEISKLDGVTVSILSLCHHQEHISQKHIWLDKYMSFIPLENRNILCKDIIKNKTSREMKCDHLRKITGRAVLIDDDNQILHYIRKELPDVILYQDSSLVD